MAIETSRLRDVIIGLILIIAGGVTLLQTLNIIVLDWKTTIMAAIVALTGLGVLLLIGYFFKPNKVWLLIISLCSIFIAGAIWIEQYYPGQSELVGVILFLLTALAFFAVFIRDRSQWWAILVGWTCLSLAGIVWLSETSYQMPFWKDVNWNDLQPVVFLGSLGIGFFLVWLTNVRKHWWALMTAGLTIAVSAVPLAGVLNIREELGVVLMFLISGVIFFLLWLIRNEENRLTWAIYPAAVLVPFSLFMYLITYQTLNSQIVLAVILIALGFFFVASYFFKRPSAATPIPAPPEPERLVSAPETPSYAEPEPAAKAAAEPEEEYPETEEESPFFEEQAVGGEPEPLDEEPAEEGEAEESAGEPEEPEKDGGDERSSLLAEEESSSDTHPEPEAEEGEKE